jgi:hypothetical protein
MWQTGGGISHVARSQKDKSAVGSDNPHAAMWKTFFKERGLEPE